MRGPWLLLWILSMWTCYTYKADIMLLSVLAHEYRVIMNLNQFASMLLNRNVCLLFTTSCYRESPSLNWGLWTRLRQEVETQRDITAATVMMRMAVVVQVVARIRRASPKSSNVSPVIYRNLQSFNLSETLFYPTEGKLNGSEWGTGVEIWPDKSVHWSLSVFEFI